MSSKAESKLNSENWDGPPLLLVLAPSLPIASSKSLTPGVPGWSPFVCSSAVVGIGTGAANGSEGCAAAGMANVSSKAFVGAALATTGVRLRAGVPVADFIGELGRASWVGAEIPNESSNAEIVWDVDDSVMPFV